MEATENQIFDTENIADNVAEQSPNCDNVAENTTDDATIWQDKYLRLSAEFDNYRKRTLREKMELVENGGADVLRAMLDTTDDFERALAAMSESPDKEGVTLIYNKFTESLHRRGVRRIEALNQPFDVDFHEAIAKVPAPGREGEIIDVVQQGYMLGDKVLRFAKVVVAE